MKKNKLFTLVLAGVMALSMAVPAFAEEVNITGSTQAPTISITVPTEGTVVINPYRMTVEVEEEEVTDKIISAVQYIVNESDVAVSVSATVTGTVAGEAVLATAALKGTETTKSVFMYLEVAEATADDGTGDPEWATAYDKATHVIVNAKGTTLSNILTLDAGDEDPTYAAFHLAGDVASAPATAWTDADTVSVKIVFTFNPVAANPEG